MANIFKWIQKKIKNEKYVLMSFGICILIAIVGYIYMGIYPFGSNSVLKIDMYHQYAPFHEELRNKLLNGGSLLYSWAGLGKNFLAQFAYYTASPLNLFLLVAKQENIPQFMGIMILLKIGFCGAFFAHYLKQRFLKDGLQIVVFAIFYGLSAYITAFYWNIMWIDVVALFPLVALGIHYIIAKSKYKTYLFSLTACIIMNFYLAFLVCIFAVIYFLVFLFRKYSIRNIKSYIKPAVMFGASSLLAGGVSMFLILPTYYALRNTAVYSSGFPQSIEVYFNMLDYIPAHFWGVTPRVMVKNESLPNIYCGVLTMMLLPSYYVCKRIALKEKILISVFLTILFLGFYINIVDFVFHGFHFPANLPHRFSFIYIFAIISIAYKTFTYIGSININWFVIGGIVFALYIFVNEKFIVFVDQDAVLGDTALILNSIFLLTYIALFILFKLKIFKKTSHLTVLLLVIVIIEFSTSAVSSLPHKGYTAIDGYTKDMANTNDIIAYLDSTDNSFYRMEFFRFKTTNDSSLLHYRGMTHFTSTANGNTTKLLERMGVSATSNSCRYYDPTQLINAMFSMKYIVYRDNVAYENVNEKIDLNFIKKFGDLSVYKNLYSLPLGYAVDGDILNWKTEQDNPFIVQNDFIKKSVGISEKMFTTFPVVGVTMKYADVTGQGDGVYSYALQYAKNLKLVPEFKAVFSNPIDQYVYLYIDSPNSLVVTVQVDNAISNRDFSAGRSTIDIGFVKANTDIIVSFTLDRRGDDEKQYRPTGTIKIFAAGYDNEVFKTVYENLNTQVLDVSEFTDASIKGTVTMKDKEILLTSIPYDAGWEIYVNGEKADSIDFQNKAFIALSLPEGTYTIEMRFIPNGLKIGIIITVISICIIALYEILSKPIFLI